MTHSFNLFHICNFCQLNNILAFLSSSLQQSGKTRHFHSVQSISEAFLPRFKVFLSLFSFLTVCSFAFKSLTVAHVSHYMSIHIHAHAYTYTYGFKWFHVFCAWPLLLLGHTSSSQESSNALLIPEVAQASQYLYVSFFLFSG